jgi:hypothetical protein
MKIFISYRRKTWPFARALADRLQRRLFSRVFVDVDSIDEDDFEHSIMRHLHQSDMFVLIASEHVFAPDYINNPNAWVRREVAEALRLDVPVVMARIDGLPLPDAEELPEDIRELANKQAEPFYAEYFSEGVARLARLIRRTHRRRQKEKMVVRGEEKPIPKTRRFVSRTWRFAVAAVIGAVLGIALYVAGSDIIATIQGPKPDATEFLTPIAMALPTRQITPASTDRPLSVTPELATSPPPADIPMSTQTPTELPTRNPAYVLAEAGVDRNADWNRYSEEINGVEMALVPAGCFTMGSIEEYNTQPLNEICFAEPFWIDVTEVTNEQFGSSGTWSEDDLPREDVTWFEAVEHCEERGARLPTEAEWEYAARGPDELVFPWGNTLYGSRVNTCDVNCTSGESNQSINDGYQYVAPVGSFPEGASWVGALDMGGNVYEWVNSLYRPYPYSATDRREALPSDNISDHRVLRGGSWINTTSTVQTAYRNGDAPSSRFSNVGFRCALSYNP